jgi:hypothetical protein
MGIGNREEQKQQHELPKSRKCIRKRFENYNNKEKLDNIKLIHEEPLSIEN